MPDGMGREFAYLSSHATNRYFIPNWGNMNNENKLLEYDEVCPYSEGRAAVRKGEFWGYVDENSKLVITDLD